MTSGYDELFVVTPVELAGLILGGAGAGADVAATALGAGDRLAMLVERIDELSLQQHDFGGNANALLGGFMRKIDRCKAELIDAEQYAAWAASLDPAGPDGGTGRTRARVRRGVPRARADARRSGRARRRRPDPRRAATRDASAPASARRFEHVLVDDAQELDLGARQGSSARWPGAG